MRKKIIFFLFLLIPTASFTDQFSNTPIGQYIFYKNNFYNAVVGILKISPKLYIGRVTAYGSTNDNVAVVTIKKMNKSRMFVPQRILKGRAGLISFHLSIMFANIYERYKFVKFKKNIYKKTVYKTEWGHPDNKTHLTFYKWIPFYGLMHIANKKGDSFKKGFEIIKIGRMLNMNDKTFFRFQGTGPISNGPAYTVPKKKKQQTVLQKTQIPLDTNWSKTEKNPSAGIYHKQYWLRVKGQRYAQIGIELLDFKKYNINDLQEFIHLFITCNPQTIDPQSVRIQFGKITKLQFDIIEEGKRTINRLIYHKTGNKKYTLINFSAFHSVYHKNKKYFDSILTKSVVK